MVNGAKSWRIITPKIIGAFWRNFRDEHKTYSSNRRSPFTNCLVWPASSGKWKALIAFLLYTPVSPISAASTLEFALAASVFPALKLLFYCRSWCDESSEMKRLDQPTDCLVISPWFNWASLFCWQFIMWVRHLNCKLVPSILRMVSYLS